MLVPAPYKAPKKKVEKEAKKTRGGLRHRGTSDTISEGSNVVPPPKRTRRRRKTNPQ